jgi:hypothetical protein
MTWSSFSLPAMAKAGQLRAQAPQPMQLAKMICAIHYPSRCQANSWLQAVLFYILRQGPFISCAMGVLHFSDNSIIL